MPMFSVVIPAYNRERMLQSALKSVLNQRFTDYEIIVVDDASTDNTAVVAHRMSDRIKVIRRSVNGGLCTVRKDGIAAATGHYIAMLDSDDIWMPWTLATYAEAIRRYHEPTIVATDGRVGICDDSDVETIPQEPFHATCSADFLDHCSGIGRSGRVILPSGIAIRSDAIRKVGDFDEAFNRTCFEDQDMYFRLGTEPGFVWVDQPLCWGYRDHAANVSKDSIRLPKGVEQLIDAERRGGYPGGKARRHQRIEQIAGVARYVSREAIHWRWFRVGWRIYWKTLTWQIACRRWRFIFGYPILLTTTALREQLLPIPHPTPTGQINIVDSNG